MAPLLRSVLLPALLLCACARSSEPSPRASAPASHEASTQPAAAPREAPRPEASPAAAAPAEPASAVPPAVAAPEAGAGGRCTSDADCALTRIDESGCCETLCTPRPVLRSELAQLEERKRQCGASAQRCPDPVCAPPRFRTGVACQAGRCAATQQSDD
ncbi:MULTISPECIES: hypothetical protein [Myxococcaceae]|uniref:hypothetical protein n=1 Tax=Myxococcaceae TaxID=31 RepID=UPI00188F63F1|nr:MULTISPECIES: hypothetical protein [Myxococcaceae]MBF5041223.1 hypothetical protein [Simulacricoccus sp. 17bor-14]